MSELNRIGEPEPDPVVAPVGEACRQRAVRAHRPLPVWVRLTFDDGRTARTEKGFALGWNGEHVLVQVLWGMSYYRGAREFWVGSDQVRRRHLEPQWLGRSA
ncbi:hypothetical protein [Sinomonas sp. RB5]